MRVEIDQTADAASIQWAPRARAASEVVAKPGRRGVRLFFDDAGDVVGLEVLGWSTRTDAPAEVQVVVQPAQAGEVFGEEHPFARALADGPAERPERVAGTGAPATRETRGYRPEP
jgi:hypothetical protein